MWQAIYLHNYLVGNIILTGSTHHHYQYIMYILYIPPSTPPFCIQTPYVYTIIHISASKYSIQYIEKQVSMFQNDGQGVAYNI